MTLSFGPGLDSTNNASERTMVRSKVRYKTMRGYKSVGGMANGIALTQWLYGVADGQDLGREMVA
jgi:hypothetical protein